MAEVDRNSVAALDTSTPLSTQSLTQMKGRALSGVEGPYLTFAEAARFEKVTIRTIERHCAAHRYRDTKLSGAIGRNGRRPVLIHIHSLSMAAQVRFYQVEEKAKTQPKGKLVTHSAKQIEAALKRLALVREALPLREKYILNGQGNQGITTALTVLADRHGATYQSLMRWMRIFKEKGFTGLLNCGSGPRKSRFNTKVLEAIQTEWLRNTQPSQADVHEAIQVYCAENLLECPSYKTVQRVIDEVPVAVASRHRLGKDDWINKFAPKVKRDMSTIEVGEYWNSDHRQFDVFVETDQGRKAVRMWLTSWMDMRSRKIVAYMISVQPNSRTIALSFRRGVMTHGRPGFIYIDNGKDYVCYYLNGRKKTLGKINADTESRGVFALLGCEVINALPYHGWAKPIERWHRNIKAWERTLPGWCGKDNKERPEKLADEITKGKLLNLSDFSRLFEVWIESYNNRVHSGIESDNAGSRLSADTPAAMWEGITREIPNERALDLLLMKWDSRTVHCQGIKVFPGRKDLHYARELGPYIGSKLTVFYDPDAIGRVYVFKGNHFLCTAVNQKFLGMKASEEDIKLASKKLAQANKDVLKYREDQHAIHHGDRILDGIVAAKKGKGMLSAISPEGSKGPGQVIPFMSKLDRAAKQIEAAPVDLIPEPVEGPEADAYGLDSDDYLEELRLAIEAKKRRLEAEKEQEADERMALYER